jgi:Uma2 family endonuclease
MATALDSLDMGTNEFIAQLPERYEVVDGDVVELPPMSDYSGQVANRLNRAVTRYLDANDIGESAVELLYRVPQVGDHTRNRRPDMAFVSYERWPRSRPISYTGNARDVVPDIAAEVVSPGDSADELLVKVREYLRGGVRLVWIVYPLAQEIHAYLPGVREVRVYLVSDELDAGDILPGFRTRVSALFPPTEPPPPATQPEPAA